MKNKSQTVRYAEAYAAEREVWKRAIRAMAAEIRDLRKKLGGKR